MAQDQAQNDKNSSVNSPKPVAFTPKEVFKPPFSNQFKTKPGNTGFNPARFKTQHKG